MKIKDGFVLRKVGKEQVVVAVGAAMKDLNGLIKLNDSGVLLWKLLEKGASEEDLAGALVKEYKIAPDRAAADTASFLVPLKEVGCIE